MRVFQFFQMEMDDSNAKACHPSPCWMNLLIALIYYAGSAIVLWTCGEALAIWVTVALNHLCVVRGLCKVLFNQKVCCDTMHREWAKCALDQSRAIKAVYRPYWTMHNVEFGTTIALSALLVTLGINPVGYGSCIFKLVGTGALLVAFAGDCVDILSDMYQAHPFKLHLPPNGTEEMEA